MLISDASVCTVFFIYLFLKYSTTFDTRFFLSKTTIIISTTFIFEKSQLFSMVKNKCEKNFLWNLHFVFYETVLYITVTTKISITFTCNIYTPCIIIIIILVWFHMWWNGILICKNEVKTISMKISLNKNKFFCLHMTVIDDWKNIYQRIFIHILLFHVWVISYCVMNDILEITLLIWLQFT